MNDLQKNFWDPISILPEKWKEEEFGKEGNGFWVVAIDTYQVIWYNDIEDGFNLSSYSKQGKIESYAAEQDELQWAIQKLINQNR